MLPVKGGEGSVPSRGTKVPHDAQDDQQFKKKNKPIYLGFPMKHPDSDSDVLHVIINSYTDYKLNSPQKISVP